MIETLYERSVLGLIVRHRAVDFRKLNALVNFLASGALKEIASVALAWVADRSAIKDHNIVGFVDWALH